MAQPFLAGRVGRHFGDVFPPVHSLEQWTRHPSVLSCDYGVIPGGHEGVVVCEGEYIVWFCVRHANGADSGIWSF